MVPFPTWLADWMVMVGIVPMWPRRWCWAEARNEQTERGIVVQIIFPRLDPLTWEAQPIVSSSSNFARRSVDHALVGWKTADDDIT